MPVSDSTSLWVFRYYLTLVAAVILATAASASDNGVASSQPSIASLRGFGAAKFGMSIEHVRKVWPNMAPLADDAKMPSAAFSSAHLERFLIEQHTLSGLSAPVNVELRFWKEQLWAFLVYFEDGDAQAALHYLEKHYGKHNTGTDTRPIWRGEMVTLQSMPEAGWFGATDNALSDAARSWFIQALTGKALDDDASTPATTAGPDSAPSAGQPPGSGQAGP